MLIIIGVTVFIIVMVVIVKAKKTTVTVEEKNERAEKMNEEDCNYWDDITKENN